MTFATTRRKKQAGALAFACVGALVVVAAVRERSRERRDLDERVRILATASEVASGALGSANETGTRHVVLNSMTSTVQLGTANAELSAAAADVERSCGREGGSGSGAFAFASFRGDGLGPDVERVAVHRDEATDGSAIAVLCVTRRRGTEERREQMTFLRRLDAGTTSAVSISRDNAIDLATMFPAEGDAPGFDPTSAPRPAHTRRLVTATVVESRRNVWIYESTDGVQAAADAYDREMARAGFETVRAADATSRLYRKGDEELVVVFEQASTTRIVMSRSR